MTQTRFCNNPEPQYGGALCAEPYDDKRFIQCSETNYLGTIFLLNNSNWGVLYCFPKINKSTQNYLFSLFEGNGITNCTMVTGELKSNSEQYLEVTTTPYECQKRVKILSPEADGMKWDNRNHFCYAKFDCSVSTIDYEGCAYCTSCSFGNYYSLRIQRQL